MPDQPQVRRIDEHWRRPPEGDAAAWMGELRQRSHDIAGWCARMEAKMNKVSTAEEIADLVERRVKRWMIGSIGRVPKVALTCVAIMQVVLLARSF